MGEFECAILNWDGRFALFQQSQFSISAPDQVFAEIAFTDDPNIFLTSARRDVIRVRDCATAELLHSLGDIGLEEFDGYGSIVWSEKLLFAARPGQQLTEVYDMLHGRLMASISGAMDQFQVHPEKKLITYLLLEDGQSPLGVILSNSALACCHRLFDPGYEISGYCFNHQGSQVVMHGLVPDGMFLFAFEFPSFKFLFVKYVSHKSEEVLASDWIAFSPGNKYVLWPISSGVVLRVDSATGAVIGELRLHDNHIVGMHARFDAELLATADSKGYVKLWRTGFEMAIAAELGSSYSDAFLSTSKLLPRSACWTDFERKRIVPAGAV